MRVLLLTRSRSQCLVDESVITFSTDAEKPSGLRTRRRVPSPVASLHPWNIQGFRHMSRYSIWIVSPPNYIHSQAFDEVALSLNAAFRALGLECEIVREPS